MAVDNFFPFSCALEIKFRDSIGRFFWPFDEIPSTYSEDRFGPAFGVRSAPSVQRQVGLQFRQAPQVS